MCETLLANVSSTCLKKFAEVIRYSAPTKGCIIVLQKSLNYHKMKLSELAALCSLSTLILTVKSFSLNKPSGAIMRLNVASSLHASRNEPDFSRAASFIVGTTLPFLFSLGQDEMNPNQLNLQLGQQHATADSTGKVYWLLHSEASS